ncbi:hypothetical protein FOL47_005274 [Perkinsus chesapeaki]|uniref:Uncharacterized protein n=1 Tax=Perkinsus chesapeaki TaxID=330153 RepID=A0A7J6LYX5_PERCH|nr:hypothetical protein FOL47_005274 [Perkinsus chesapeaki]
MHSISQRIVIVATFISAAYGHINGELRGMELERYSSEDMHSNFNQTPANDGGCYERPKGKCGADLMGCTCIPLVFNFVYLAMWQLYLVLTNNTFAAFQVWANKEKDTREAALSTAVALAVQLHQKEDYLHPLAPLRITMQPIFEKVLLVVAFNTAVLGCMKEGETAGIEVEKYSSDDMHFPFKQVPTNDGGCYERPNGHCEYDGDDIVGCSCNPSETLLFFLLYPYLDLRVVCGDTCSNATKCPEPPKGTKGCIDTVCVLTCSDDKDCINGGACTDTDAGSFCMYDA